MMALGYRALCLPVLMMVLPCSIVTILLSGGGSREPVRAEMPRMASTIRLSAPSSHINHWGHERKATFTNHIKIQQQRVNQFCQKHGYQVNHSMITGKGDIPHQLSRHLIFSDEKKLIYCFAPKTGCTNLKRLMLYTTGHIPLHTLSWPWVENKVYLEPALKSASFLNSTLTAEQKLHRLSKYFKFMVVRHPLERLVSGFRNKLESPVIFSKRGVFPQSVKRDILKQFQPKVLRRWHTLHGSYNISVGFPLYVQYVVKKAFRHNLNEHFILETDICHPCAMRYDFYVNFRTITSDIADIIDKFEMNTKYYRNESLHHPGELTREVMHQYFSQLSVKEKLMLLDALREELDFHYSLFPDEKDSHYDILNL